jgi:phytoene synthase
MVIGLFTLLTVAKSCELSLLMVNNIAKIELAGPQRLAIAYAPKVAGAQLAWLLRFDQRLGAILVRAKEPMIVQLRFAWWRDAFHKPFAERPSGEPLIAELLAFNCPPLIQTALALVDAWELMVGEPDADEQFKSATMRTGAIFGAYADWIGCTAAERETALSLGLCWSGEGDRPHRSAIKKLRPLSILAFAAYLGRAGVRAGGLRLSWHALTGR